MRRGWLGKAGGDAGEGVEAFEHEGRTGAVAEEAFETGAVVTLDAHGSVDAEPAGTLPGEHIEGVELVEQRVDTGGSEPATPEHATLKAALEPGPVPGLEERRLPEDGLTIVPIVASRET